MALLKREHRTAWPLEPLWSEDRIDRAFREMLRETFGGVSLMDRLFERDTNVMRIEEFVDGDTCVIRAELPGMDPDKDVEITVADGVLRLLAQREEKREVDLPHGYRSEFRYGSLSRSIRLPEGATEDDVQASYKDGILEVRVPISREATKSAKKIPVQHD